MYLKSIEVHGFKSFANKIVFEFHDGITGIVGPNGSGKSNVGDAVRWVLGEQSAKQLRGAKMEDVIFSGTEQRKSMGYAYVAITLDNSDHKLPTSYEEVTIARRVFRSGESEYLMNGVTCRLRDIQDLFLDTGIGKEGYSIIGQGQIDKILSGKPEERRELFDEAAGIAKFKKRKVQAEKNLEVERQNLCRITDILSEIEKQIIPLEKQSETAKKYLDLREELKTLDVNMFLIEYHNMKQSITSLEEKLKAADSDLEQIKREYANTKKEYEQLEKKLEQLNNQVESQRVQLEEIKITKEQLEGKINVLKEQIIAAKQNSEHYQVRLKVVFTQLEEKEQKLKEQLEQQSKLEQQRIEKNETVQQADQFVQHSQQQMMQIRQQVEQYNKEVYDILNETVKIKTQLQHFETMLEQIGIQKAALNQRIVKIKSDEADFQEKREENETTKKELNIQLKTTKEEELAVQNFISDQNTQLHQLQNDLETQQANYHKEYSRLESLRNMTERYEGYGISIKRVMEQKKEDGKIIGVVADIIKVKKDYETAIEISLGGSIQNIVTDKEETAKQLISYLKKHQYGRATFLPLTSVRGRTIPESEAILKEKEVIGLASTLVTVEERFQELANSLLGRIVVIDTIEHAIQIAKKYHYSYRIVTLEGELLNPGGSLSGGAYRNSSNLLSRRREITELEHKIRVLQDNIQDKKITLEQVRKDRETKRAKLEEVKQTLQQLYVLQNTVQLTSKQIKAEELELKEEQQKIQKEHVELEKKREELKESITKLQEDIKENEKLEQVKQKQVIQFTNQIEQEQKQVEQAQQKYSEQKLSLASVEQSMEFIKENINRIRLEIEQLQAEQQNLQEGKRTSKEQILQKEKEIEQTKEEMNQYEMQAQEQTKLIEKAGEEQAEISQRHKECLFQREEFSSKMNQLDKEIFRFTSQKEKVEEQLEKLLNYMWEEYELTYNKAYERKTETDLTYQQLKEKIGQLRNKIKVLGNVNVNAISDYKELKERYELLKTQHDDVVDAEKVLLGIIEELDIEMRKQFQEKFLQIKEQFDLVFKELFGGGRGTLELTEEEDILEAGIRIIAQPPGKKLQNMMQLSGGEKALAAISLLFAIQNLKPSPFCLLDEIEAALDDSNVGRYAKYLHKLTEHTQFIIITHRRGTMAAADVLYGITMQEKGVSTLVSVNLIENELEK